MKYTARTSKIKSIVVSIAACVALLMCTLFSLGTGIGRHSSGETGSNDIRFVQVAAGNDFAIGLTAYGDLYGWSLIENKTTKGDANSQSLGEYYTNIPTKIDVTFFAGPGDGQNPISSGDTNKYYEKIDDRIVQIAATRNTAAFITEKKRIYTWGRDGDRYHDIAYGNISGSEHSLLLRAPADTSPWYVPYIINYNYYSDGLAYGLKRIHPYNMTNMSIAGGEYNYIIVYAKNSAYCTYVWGSEMYAVSNGDTTNASSQYSYLGEVQHDYPSFKVFNTGLNTSSGAGRLTAVAGGYTVGYNDSVYNTAGGTSLSLHGKNFITSVPVSKTGNDYQMIKTADVTTGSGKAALKVGEAVVDSSTINVKALDAIIGAEGNGGYVEGSANGEIANSGDKYYGRQASPGTNALTYGISNNNEVGTVVYASDGRTALGGTAFKAVHNAVSLGNDIGYGISGGKLYAWGDNAQGQLGNNSADANSSKPTGILTDKSFVTVAAGKQLSGLAKPFNTTNTLVESGGTYKFNDGTAELNGGTEAAPNACVINDAAYITGAITTGGDLWVWSNLHKEPRQIFYGDKSTNNNNSFIAVYSGYGNHLFAITKLGKVVQIEATDSGYDQIIHDKFNNGEENLVNWEITDFTNSVTFTVPNATAAVPEPALGSMTFYVGSGSASQASVKLNGVSSSEESTTVNYKDNSLIKSNAICDVYRILDPARDTAISFVDTTGTGSRADSLSAAELTPKFRFKETGADLRPVERENLFDYAFVYSATDGTGIRIAPKRATKGTITMEFYVARYDCATNFTVTGSGDGATVSDQAVYYDYQKCTVEFTVDNTAAYVKFADFAGVRPEVDGETDYSAKPNGNSLIPLLDPNNEHNNKYSIALQDVTSGVKALVRYLQGLENNAAVNTSNDVYKAILDEMKARDLGFPDSEKIAKGDLEYYLGNDESGTQHNRNNAHDKYNDEYQYLFADRDTDLILFSTNTPVTVNGSGVEGTINPIKITIDITSSINVDKLSNLSTDFLNVYGLYNFARGTRTTSSGEVNTLSFMYNTVLFTAKGSTNRIRYAESGDIATYDTTNGSGNWARSNVRVSEYLGNSADYDPNVTGITIPAARQYNSIMSVFAQTTLRLSQSKMTGQGNIVYGNSNSANSYTLSDEYIRSKGFRVGTTKTIELSEFLDFTDDNSIHFSYNNQFNDFAEFNRQFYDELNPANNVVILSQNKIEITPTTTRPLYFTVTIQRFFANNKSFANNNEKITIVVNIPTIADFTLAKSNASTSFNISAPVTIDLFGRTNNPNAFNESSLLSELLDSTYTSVMSITDFATTNANVASAVRTNGSTTSITVTPGTSGKATVMFVVSVLGKTLPMQLSFNVAGITPVAGTIELSDVKSVYVSALLTEIRSQNSFVSGVATGYDVITTDIDENGKPAAIQFYNSNGELVTENGGKPRFVGNVRFTDTDTENPRIRLEINDNVVDNITEEYYMRVRFVDTTRGLTTYQEYVDGGYTVLSTSQKIVSTKSVVMGGADGTDMNNPYVVNIDCDTPKPQGDNTNSDWYTVGSGNDMKVRVPIRMLLNLINEENPQDFQAALVRSDSKTSNYMYYSIDETARYIEITPLYNTEVDENGIADPVVISVSVTPVDAASTRANRILSFRVTVSGISTTLDKDTYTTIWLVAFFASLGLLIIIFLIRMIVYWRKRAKQRALIKRNQELIKMRDRIHNKATSATREQIVKTKLKMNDPKYARMLGDIKRDRADAADSTGVVLENADMPEMPSLDDKGKKKKKKKGGKKSIAELKAELEAKKAAVLAAQNGGGMPPFGADVPLDAQPYGMPDGGFGSPDQGFGGGDQGFGSPVDAFAAQDLGSEIIFDAPDDGVQG